MIKTNEFWIKKMQSFADIKNAVIVKVCLVVYLLVTLIIVIISNIFYHIFRLYLVWSGKPHHFQQDDKVFFASQQAIKL